MAPTPDALAREWFDQVWNKLDESAIDRLMSPDALVHGLGPEPMRGPAQFKSFYHMFRDAFGGIRVDVEQTVTQGDMCTALCHVVVMHTGDTLGGPPTNRALEFWGMTMVRTQGETIVEGWNAFDFLTMYQQMGWVPNPVVPAA